MNDNERQFKGVWIPAEIWLDENLTKMEMLTLVEIDSLSKTDMGCFASNQHFADFLRVGKERVKKILSSLVEKGYVTSVIERNKDTKQIEKRILYCTYPSVQNYPTLGYKNTLPYGTKVPYPSVQKYPTPRVQKYPDNNTILSNTSNNTISNTEYKDIVGQAQPHIPCKEVIDYLNENAGTNYRSTTPKTIKLIKARFKEGFTLDDFKTVISRKCKQWYGDKNMSKYLRPETLFGSKFEGYLNESDVSIYGTPSSNSSQDVFDELDRLSKELGI